MVSILYQGLSYIAASYLGWMHNDLSLLYPEFACFQFLSIFSFHLKELLAL